MSDKSESLSIASLNDLIVLNVIDRLKSISELNFSIFFAALNIFKASSILFSFLKISARNIYELIFKGYFFIDKENKDDVILIDASNLGKKVKDGKNQKTLLSKIDEQKIIDTFCSKEALDDFSVVVSYNDIAAKNYSLSAGQYFDVKIEYVDITQKEFNSKLSQIESNLDSLSLLSNDLNSEIMSGIKKLKSE